MDRGSRAELEILQHVDPGYVHGTARRGAQHEFQQLFRGPTPTQQQAPAPTGAPGLAKALPLRRATAIPGGRNVQGDRLPGPPGALQSRRRTGLLHLHGHRPPPLQDHLHATILTCDTATPWNTSPSKSMVSRNRYPPVPASPRSSVFSNRATRISSRSWTAGSSTHGTTTPSW